MKTRSNNQSGFTLTEEVISILLISILVVSSSGILVNAVRIFGQNAIILSAQEKGIAVCQQLEESLTYAQEISTVAEATPFYTDHGEKDLPYQLVWNVNDEGYVTANSLSVYSSSQSTEEDRGTAENRLCQLGNYQVRYTLEYHPADGEMVLYLEVENHNRTYYAEERVIVLKNEGVVVDAADFPYDSNVSDEYLHIGSLE